MPTYATAADFRAYSPRFADLSDEAINVLIEAAERDVDNACGPRVRDEATGRKFVPATLSTLDARALTQAVCVQAEYRQVMGPEFFVRPQYAEVSGPDYSTKGKLARFSPDAFAELQGSSLLRLTTTWQGHGDDPPWRDFAYG